MAEDITVTQTPEIEQLAASILASVTPAPSEEVTPSTPPSSESQESQETQEPPPEPLLADIEPSDPYAHLDPSCVERVHVVEATRWERVEKVAQALIQLRQNVDDEVLCCAMGMVLCVVGAADLVTTAHHMFMENFPARGDKVQGQRGEVGVVVSIVDVQSAIVKWAHMKRATREPIAALTIIEFATQEL